MPRDPHDDAEELGRAAGRARARRAMDRERHARPGLIGRLVKLAVLVALFFVVYLIGSHWGRKGEFPDVTKPADRRRSWSGHPRRWGG